MQQVTLRESTGKLILFATILASGMAFLDGSVVNIAVPTIQSQLQATLPQVQWIINGYMLMLSSLILISGALGDVFGRKRIFLFGIGVFTLASFLCSTAHSITFLTFARMVQGIGGALMVPGSLSIINAAFAHEIRGKVIGMWSGYSGGLIALGPFVGGWLVQTLGWQSIFYINIPLGVLAFIIASMYIPESKSEEKRSIDFVGTLLIFLSLLGMAYGLITGPDSNWSSSIPFVTLALGIVCFVLFIVVQIKSRHPLIPLEIFHSPLVIGANLVTLFLYFALNGTLFFFVLNLQQIQHYPPIFAGLAMLPSTLLITFLSGPAGGLADRIGPRMPMIIGPLLVACGMFLLVLPGNNANYFVSYLPGLLLFGLGMSLVIAPLTKSALSVQEKFSGAASGVNNAVARVAGLFAVAICGALMLSLFSTQLNHSLQTMHISANMMQAMSSQENKLGAMHVADQRVQPMIATSFLYGFRWVMGINAGLALLSSIISFLTIKPVKKS